MGRGWSRLILPGMALVGVLLVVGIPSFAQDAFEPDGEAWDADCYAHHRAQGFRSMDLVPERISSAPRGQAFEVHLTVRNPWRHELHDVAAYLNVSHAPGIGFPGEREPWHLEKTGTIRSQGRSYGTLAIPIPVEENATDVLVSLVGAIPESLPPRAQKLPDYRLLLASPDGASVRLGSSPPAEYDATAPHTNTTAIAAGVADVFRGGTGTWQALISYGGLPEEGAFVLRATVHYNQSRASQILLPGPALLKPNEQHTFTFPVIARDAADLQHLRYGGLGTAHYDHSDAGFPDDGLHDKWNTMTFTLGAQLVVGPPLDVGGDLDLLSPLLRRWAQVLGFSGSFLLLPALVLGGTMGPGSVRLLNRAFGGPRRRVLLHNAASFSLLALSLTHLGLVLYESFWGWSQGLVWGGLALSCMVGLGVTGALQRRFVARWGFGRWRFVHFAMGLLVVVFLAVHLMADGSHLAPLREAWFGKNPAA